MRSRRSTPVDVASPTIRFSPDMRERYNFLSGTVFNVIAPRISTATLTGKANLSFSKTIWIRTPVKKKKTLKFSKGTVIIVLISFVKQRNKSIGDHPFPLCSAKVRTLLDLIGISLR